MGSELASASHQRDESVGHDGGSVPSIPASLPASLPNLGPDGWTLDRSGDSQRPFGPVSYAERSDSTWKCRACEYLTNPRTEAQCVICRNPREGGSENPASATGPEPPAPSQFVRPPSPSTSSVRTAGSGTATNLGAPPTVDTSGPGTLSLAFGGSVSIDPAPVARDRPCVESKQPSESPPLTPQTPLTPSPNQSPPAPALSPPLSSEPEEVSDVDVSTAVAADNTMMRLNDSIESVSGVPPNRAMLDDIDDDAPTQLRTDLVSPQNPQRTRSLPESLLMMPMRKPPDDPSAEPDQAPLAEPDQLAPLAERSVDKETQIEVRKLPVEIELSQHAVPTPKPVAVGTPPESCAHCGERPDLWLPRGEEGFACEQCGTISRAREYAESITEPEADMEMDDGTEETQTAAPGLPDTAEGWDVLRQPKRAARAPVMKRPKKVIVASDDSSEPSSPEPSPPPKRARTGSQRDKRISQSEKGRSNTAVDAGRATSNTTAISAREVDVTGPYSASKLRPPKGKGPVDGKLMRGVRVLISWKRLAESERTDRLVPVLRLSGATLLDAPPVRVSARLVVVCPEWYRSYKVLWALVHGVPIVHPNWVYHSVAAREVLDVAAYRLKPPGRVLPMDQPRRDPFSGARVEVVGGDGASRDQLTRLLTMAGARVVRRLTGIISTGLPQDATGDGLPDDYRIDYVLLLGPPNDLIHDYLVSGVVPLTTQEWGIQCILQDRLIDPAESADYEYRLQ